MENAKVGMKVSFGRTNGEKTLGIIKKVNLKSAKVEALENRGVRGAGIWNVHWSLITPVGDNGTVPIIVKPQRIVYSQFAGVDNLILEAMGNIYADFSPENLTCDGERAHSEVIRVSRELNRKLQGLFQAYGRTVSEEEVYDWERQKKQQESPTLA